MAEVLPEWWVTACPIMVFMVKTFMAPAEKAMVKEPKPIQAGSFCIIEKPPDTVT